MLVGSNLAVVVHDTDVAAAVVVLPAGDLAAAVVPHVLDDEAVLVSVPDPVPAHGASAGRPFVGESSTCGGHCRHPLCSPSLRSCTPQASKGKGLAAGI